MCPQPGRCLIQTPAGLTTAATYIDSDDPFQFPVDPLRGSAGPISAPFCTFGTTTRGPEYHAAEDYLRPAGTPVYAIADGDLSFSGPMGGYGWLIIIDHPQFNLYSLYGHLSPSRWAHETGPVAKGELIGYLGDDDENGGSAENPLRPHLHLGLRAGQRQDYPGNGQWRWMAGWIKPCPADTGWLPPSATITAQEIPPAGLTAPAGHFLARWGVELLFLSFYAVGAGFMLIFAFRRQQPLPPSLPAAYC